MNAAAGAGSGRGWQKRSPRPGPRDNRPAAYLLGATLLGLWTWWALSDGGFFGTVLFPGGIMLYVVLALTLTLAQPALATKGPHTLALGALLGLAAWTALSILWTPARGLAFDYSQRAFIYVAAFAVGLVFTTALRRRMALSVVPLLAAGAIVAVVVLIRIWTSSDLPSLIDVDGTLNVPFGYRNANAGFFAMVALGSIAFGARERNGTPTRSATAGLAAVALCLAAVSQSRGSLIAVVVGVVVLLAATPGRGRALLGLVIVALPVAVAFPQLLDPFSAADGPSDVALTQLREAGLAAVAAGAGAALLSLGVATLEHRGLGARLPTPSRRQRRVGLVAVAVVATVALVAFAVGPASNEIDSISSGDTSYGTVGGSRFTYGGGLNRTDFWRVAVDQFADQPLAGGGAGSFRSTYLLDRTSDEAPRNAHSIWLETLGELGLVGLILLCTGVAGAVLAALRSRRLGPENATLSATALTVLAVWLAQASIDWSWYFAALTAPSFALLGSAAAPGALGLEPLPARARMPLGAGAIVLALIAVPSFVSDRLTATAASSWPGDRSGAYRALSTAADLNPFADSPLLVEAQIARQTGNAPRALDAVREAQVREPDNWLGYLIAAQALQRVSATAALQQVEAGLALNPQSQELQKLKLRLERDTAG